MAASKTPSVAILGTGIIGSPVARNLAKSKFDVRAWNRTRSKAEELASYGVHVAKTPADAVKDAKIIITVLKDQSAVLEAMRAASSRLTPGAVWIQLSTVGEGVAELATFASEHDLVFVDAPVQGTRQPAEDAKLVIMAAGPQAVRDDIQPLFDAIGERTIWLAENGGSGAASRLKLVLNTWVIALTHGVAEALALAKGLGVDPHQFVDVVTGGPMDSGYFQAKASAIMSGDYTTSFSVDNAEKDAGLVLAAADRVGIRTDTVRVGRERFARASERGHGEQDMSAAYFASFPT